MWGEKAIERGGLMEYIATFDYTLYADTPELARFASGFLIKEILDNFSQKANSTLNPDRSLWIYSGHDYSIVNALNSLGLFKEVHFIELTTESFTLNVTIVVKFSLVFLKEYSGILNNLNNCYL